MTRIVFVGADWCGPCHAALEEVIRPLAEDYPGQVECHMGWDRKVSEIDQRRRIRHVPTVVVEEDGEERMRWDGCPSEHVLMGVLED